MTGSARDGSNWRSKWIVSLVNGQIRIHSRAGLDLTTEDQRTIIMLLADHFRSETLSTSRKAMTRPAAGETVETKTGIAHILDPVVEFLVAYRIKRKISLVAVAKRMGMSTGQRLGATEAGRVRPYIEFLREWGYALNFNLMPIPVAMASHIRDMVNQFLETQYYQDIMAWTEYSPTFVSKEGSHANIPAGAELLRDGVDAGPAAPRQAAAGDLPDPRDPVWGEHALHDEEPPGCVDVEGQ